MSAIGNDTTKLTVPQLKALCKARNISGYSKLTKAALIQKLTDSGSTGCLVVSASGSTTKDASNVILGNEGGNNALERPYSLHSVGETSGTAAGVVQSGPSAIVDLVREAVNVSQAIQDGHTNISESLPTLSSSTPGPVHVSVVNRLSVTTGAVAVTLDLRVPQASRKKKTALIPQVTADGSTPSGGSSAVFKVPALPTKIHTVANPQSTSVSSVGPESGSSATSKRFRSLEAVAPLDTGLPSKRLKVAVLKKPTTQKPSRVIASSSNRALQEATRASVNAQQPSEISIHTRATSSGFKPLVVNGRNSCAVLSTTVPPSHVSLGRSNQKTDPPRRLSPFFYLDLPPSPAISLHPIAMPPSLLQRKCVSFWVMLFGHLSKKDLAVCVQVSRMFRYAVYLSALYRLKQYFGGYRLAYVLGKCHENITNMWPYLRLRELELSSSQQAYNESFLPRCFQHSNPISHRLWTNPDHDKQTTVAIRFLLTRLWFSLSSGYDQREFDSWKVIDAQELAKGEIWSVSCQSSSSTTQTFYVLESTCEVIGRPPVSPDLDKTTKSHAHPSLPVRVDWSEYISQRLLPLSSHDAPPPPLLHYLKWANYEEYDKGISKHWLTRIACEGDVGVAKRVVAQRYVLACVVGNSISGQWMTTQQMAQEFAGLPARVPLVDRKQHTVGLFLPCHHHIESVHFSTASGIPLHRALAVVQTPAREYYILKDNGMTVGCEEDGVGDVWQQLLECDRFGVEKPFVGSRVD